MAIAEKHFVTFYSPGTFVAETTTKAIASWDPRAAAEMASCISERYGARPYGFQFSTRLCADPIDDGRGGTLDVRPRETAKSGMYYLNGKIETLADVEARNDPSESILRSNMHGNGYDRVVVTTNGYKSVHPFLTGDTNLDASGNILEIG